MSLIQYEYEDILSNPDFHRQTVKKVVKIIQQHYTLVPLIACRGSSGAAVAYPVAYELGLEVCHVRKDGERSHSDTRIGNHPEGRPYVIVDDFIHRGTTVRDILYACGLTNCAGIIVYMDQGDIDHNYQYEIKAQSIHDNLVFGSERSIPVYALSRYRY